MISLTVTETRTHLSEIIRRIDRTMEYFVISRNGKPRAIIMSVDEYAGWLETLEIMPDKKTLKDIQEAKKELAEGKGYTLEEVFKGAKRKKR